MIGTALGTAVAGALLGPVLGALAASIGTEPVFGSVLVDHPRRSPSPPRVCPRRGRPSARAWREVVDDLLSRPILNGAIFVAVPSVMFGAIEVLVPLRIDALGGGHGVIAAGFIGGAALEAVLAPIAGRLSDRVGRRTALRRRADDLRRSR